MLGFAVLGVVVFFLSFFFFLICYTAFAFVCLFATEANCELPVIVFSGFYYITQNSQHWLAESIWTEYTVGQPVLRVMYCIVKRCRKVLELSHYFVLRYLLLLLLSFPYDRNRAKYELENLVIGFVDVLFLFFLSLAHIPPSLKKRASKMVILYGYL